MIKIADIIGKGEEDKAEIRQWLSRTEQNFYEYFVPSEESQKKIILSYCYNKIIWLRLFVVFCTYHYRTLNTTL